MRVLSLDHALSQDERFDRVRQGREQLWYLRRLEPAEVQIGAALAALSSRCPIHRGLLSVEMLQLEWELDDEWGESSLSSEVPSVVPSTSLILTYPHRRYGTLPLSGRTRSFFPPATGGVSLVTLVDGRWGTRYTGWVMHEARYVTGLAKWMDDHQLPVGAFITLERTPATNEIDRRLSHAAPQARMGAHCPGRSGRNTCCTFEMNKINVACEYDEHMIVAEQERAGAGPACASSTEQRGTDVPEPGSADYAGAGEAEPAGHRTCQERLQRRQRGTPHAARPGILCPD